MLVDVQLWRSSSDTAATTLNREPIDCIVDGTAWSCPVPAVPVDAKISIPGFVPHYILGLAPAAGETRKLGAVTFARGASVSGWVTVKQRSATAGGIVVEMVPAVGDAGAKSVQHRPAASTNERGFFQISGVPGGVYDVVARKEGWSSARISAVKVVGATSVDLERPLIVAPLATLMVWLDAPGARTGRGWRISVDRVDASSRYLHNIAAAQPVSPEAPWVGKGLENGQYVVSISDGEGSIRARETVDVGSDLAEVRVRVDEIPIRGRISAGDRPLQAELRFTWSDGAAILMQSDDRGDFEGSLSHEGKWRVQIAPTDSRTRIRGRTVDVHRRPQDDVARVDIALPDGRLGGGVVDESGKAVPNALVSIIRGVRPDAEVLSDADGNFELVGIEPGPVMVGAETRDAESGYVAASADRAGSPVRLVVAARRTLSGRLVDPAGNPVAGARLRAVYAAFAPAEETTTDAAGRFRLRAPRSATQIDMVVLAAGWPIKIISVPLSEPSEPVLLTVSGPSSVLAVTVAGVPAWPAIRRDTSGFFSLRFLLSPTGTGGSENLGPDGLTFLLEAGAYELCPDPVASARCTRTTIAPGQKVVIDARGYWTREEREARAGR